MNKGVERDLLSLLPSITLPLPRELLDRAISLLTQSRTKASRLKQDEEIARGYVCANLACDRLKTKLDLPTIIVRPPVAPKTYKKVYAYLESALSSGTPQKRKHEDGLPVPGDPSTPSKSRIQRASETPSKSRAATARTPQTRLPAAQRSSAKRKLTNLEDDGNLPSWAMPAIRDVCTAFRISNVAPHIFVGVSSIVKVIREQQASAAQTPSRKRARKPSAIANISQAVAGFEDKHIPAIIVVVTLHTLTHLHGVPSSEESIARRQKAIDSVLHIAPSDGALSHQELVDEVELLLQEAENEWLDMDWYRNLPEPALVMDDLTSAEREGYQGSDDDEGVAERCESVLPRRGFGTMMTDATDWLSDERRAEYKRWKAGILQRIALIERSESIKV